MNGTTMESDHRCTACPFWSSRFSYGHTEELVGFVSQEASWSEPGEDTIRRTVERHKALAEMKDAYAHPDFKAMYDHAPRVVLAGWLEDHDFPVQSRALADQIVSAE
jgi:hypothetical protein